MKLKAVAVFAITAALSVRAICAELPMDGIYLGVTDPRDAQLEQAYFIEGGKVSYVTYLSKLRDKITHRAGGWAEVKDGKLLIHMDVAPDEPIVLAQGRVGMRVCEQNCEYRGHPTNWIYMADPSK